jgi:hypothetical protein
MSRVRQERDVIAVRTITAVALVALAAFSVGILWAAIIVRDRTGALRSRAESVYEAGKAEIGLVFQATFATSPIAARRAPRQLERLGRFGYTDSTRRSAFIPIERAKQLVVERGKL